jgi:hypothetical protein
MFQHLKSQKFLMVDKEASLTIPPNNKGLNYERKIQIRRLHARDRSLSRPATTGVSQILEQSLQRTMSLEFKCHVGFKYLQPLPLTLQSEFVRPAVRGDGLQPPLQERPNRGMDFRELALEQRPPRHHELVSDDLRSPSQTAWTQHLPCDLERPIVCLRHPSDYPDVLGGIAAL